MSAIEPDIALSTVFVPHSLILKSLHDTNELSLALECPQCPPRLQKPSSALENAVSKELSGSYSIWSAWQQPMNPAPVADASTS